MPYLNSTVIGIFCAPNTGDDNNAVTQSSGVTSARMYGYHVAVTINGSTIKQYINGKLYVTDSLTDLYALTGTEVLTLATDYSNTTYANIKMDEVRYGVSIAPSSDKSEHVQELAGNEANLLSYYKMSDGPAHRFRITRSQAHTTAPCGRISWSHLPHSPIRGRRSISMVRTTMSIAETA